MVILGIQSSNRRVNVISAKQRIGCVILKTFRFHGPVTFEYALCISACEVRIMDQLLPTTQRERQIIYWVLAINQLTRHQLRSNTQLHA